MLFVRPMRWHGGLCEGVSCLWFHLSQLGLERAVGMVAGAGVKAQRCGCAVHGTPVESVLGYSAVVQRSVYCDSSRACLERDGVEIPVFSAFPYPLSFHRTNSFTLY
jgi:hypothetical protein